MVAQSCDNLTDGGTISGDESGCGNPTFDPAIITSVAPATGGSGTIQYMWMKTTGDPNSPFNTWDIIPGATGENYDPTPITETTYYGRCSRRAGCTEFVGETNFVVKSINCCDINASISPANTTACSGQPLMLTANGDGTGLTYAWEATGGTFNDSTLASPTYTMMMEGTYTIKVTISKDDCTETAETTVIIDNQLDVSISAATSTINTGESLALNSSVSGSNPIYAWTATGGTFSSTTVPNPTYNPSGAGNFQIYLTATDENGCSGVDTFNITVEDCSLALIGIAENVSCNSTNDGSITVTPSGANGTVNYAWSLASIGNTATATGLSAGSYSVTATDGAGCTAVQNIEVETDASFTLSPNIQAPTCAGDSNGQIRISVNGGDAPFTYSWSSNLPDTNFVNNLAPSTYGLTVTDASGCQVIENYTVNSTDVIMLTVSTNDPDCGASNGSATVTASGGTPPYTYAWNDANNQTTSSATNLPSGTYQVVVTDTNGCQNTTSAIVNNATNSNIVLTTVVTNISCTNLTGSIDLTIAGGTAPYTIAWDSGIGAVEDPSGLAAGTYNVLVTDADGCSNNATATIIEENEIVLTTVVTDISCTNPAGAIDLTIAGGTAPYTIAWDNSIGAVEDPNGLAIGTYNVTVTDANGCMNTANATISDMGGSNIVLTTVITNTSCNNASGSIDLTIAGGTAPYGVLWDRDIGGVEDPNGLAAGTYNVTVTDANGCTNTAMATITEDTNVAVMINKTDLVCNGANDGTATATATGGSGTYTYLWDSGLPPGAAQTGLSAGTYTVTATDSTGCQGTATVTILQPVSFSVAATPMVTDCTSPTGSATATPTGGMAPYTYAWNDGANQTTQTAVNLSPGTYGVTVTDTNGCSATDNVIVNDSMGLVVTLSTTDALCNGENSGTITTNVSNGTPPYNYQWNNSLPNFPGFTGLAQGTYIVTVTDANGCFGTAEAKVHGADSLIVTPVVENARCMDDDGRARLDVRGGTPPYAYAWGAPINSSNNVVTDLATGSYEFTVTDANGCTQTDVIVVLRDTNCVDSCKVDGGIISTTDSTTICAGDGIADNITVTLTGNQGANNQWIVTSASLDILELPDSNIFNFDGAGFGTCLIWNVTHDGTISGLIVGQNAGDLTGCFDLSNSITVIREDCSVMDTCMVDGGTISTTDSTTICAGDGVADDIAVNLTGNQGANNQWIVTSESLDILELPNSNVFNFDGTGFGTCLIWNVTHDGTIGGLIVGQNAGNLTGCFDLSNSITVIREDCSMMDTCMVEGGTISTTDSTTICAGDGIADDITITLMGSQGANNQWIVTSESLDILELPNNNTFNFDGAGFGTCLIWNVTHDGSIGGLVVGQNAGNLTGCFDLSNSISVIREDCSVDTCTTTTPSTISTSDATVFCVKDGILDSVKVNLSIGMGDFSRFIITDTALNIIEISTNTIYEFDDVDFGVCLIWNLTYADGLTGLTVGENVSGLSGCFSLSNAITIVRQDCRPDPCLGFEGSVRINNPASGIICSQANIALSTSPADTNFTYQWTASGGTFSDSTSANPTYSMMMPGTHQIFVIVTRGECVTRDTTTVTIVDGPMLALSTTDVVCQGSNDGTIMATVTGGTMPYSYTWNNSLIGDTASASNLPPAFYEVVVTDANGCTATGATTIAEGAFLSLTLVPNNATCENVNEGSISAIVNGGTAPYAYTWSTGAADTAFINNLAPGNYALTVTDANGCTVSDTVTLDDPILFEVDIISTPTDICPGGSINFGLGSVDTTLSYQWTATGGTFDDPLSTSPIYTMMMPGTYQVIVVAGGRTCFDSDTIDVFVRERPNISVTSTNVSCVGDSTGSITVTASNNVLPLSYTWNNGLDSLPNQTNLPAGTYILTVTDGAGCTISDTTTIIERSNLVVDLMATNLDCNGADNGQITATATGGVAPLTYSWSNGAGNQATINSLAAGDYSVTVTDSLGCSQTASITLAEPVPIIVAISNPITGAICAGTPVNLAATPVDANLTYTWTATGGSFNDSTSATPVYTMMMAGTYEIVLTVSNGTCIARDTTTVSIGTSLDYTLTSTNERCAGARDGSINLTLNDGFAPFTFTWDKGFGNITNPTGLAPDIYRVTITDGNGCTRADSVTIEPANDITVSLLGADIVCHGDSTGTVDAIIIGGVDTLTYVWSTGSTNPGLTNLPAGVYSLSVTDANGCTASDTITINEPSPLMVTATGQDIGCEASGQAFVTASGETAPYTYLWNDAAAQTTDTATNLIPGTYLVVVRDANGCTTSATASITDEAGISCNINVLQDIRTFNGSEGILGVTATGGSGNYTYRWNNGGMDSTITGLSTNTYIVTVTDDIGCGCSDTLELLNPAILGDFVFQDVDSSGTQDAGEPGIGGVSLQISGTTYYGAAIVRNVTTNADGIYQVPLPPGDYKVTVVDAFGYAFTTPNVGGNDGIDSDFDPNTNMSPVVTLNENDVILTVDLGLIVTEGCQNVLQGGRVERDETLCSSDADPSIITNVAFPSGGSGQLEYLWLKSDITRDYFPGHPDWEEIPNSNAPDYDPEPITRTTYYIRCSRRAGCDSYPGETNIITKTVINCATIPSAENLRASVQTNQVELTWEGKIPYENGNYIIERSTDAGRSYQVIDLLESPISETMSEFQYMDKTPNFGENYYRVKTVVPNMSSAFTNIAMAMVKPENAQRVMFYPNPVQSEITVQFLEELAETAKVQIVNGFGQVMKSFEVDTANKKQQLDISDLPSGIYYVKFNNRALKRFGQKIYKVEE
ncbi:MAG: SdrD B-like domain-containing protein [Bacteroidota bacterium]